MLPLEHPDRIQIAFDDHRLVNNAGLLLPATLGKVGRRRVTPINEALFLQPLPNRTCDFHRIRLSSALFFAQSERLRPHPVMAKRFSRTPHTGSPTRIPPQRTHCWGSWSQVTVWPSDSSSLASSHAPSTARH